VPFISFEGVDGSGKTTQQRLLGDWLEAQGSTVIRTREPGGGALGTIIRSIFVAPDRATPLTHLEEFLLINAARCDHVQSVIRPALNRGDWILADRFIDSTYALQIYGTSVSETLFEETTKLVIGDIQPDITFVLDLCPSAAQERRSARGVNDDPAEKTRDFERIRMGYLQRVEREPVRCRLIDGNRDEVKIANDIRDAVMLLVPDSDAFCV
jgi:dTMP kinase